MLELAVVVPTLNETENLEPLVERLERALAGIEWEVVFVDDDSPDGTADRARRLALANPRVRVLERIGRQGLASACIEGMLATAAPYVAVMDADLQHDEAILPEMLRLLQQERLDLVVGSRSGADGGLGGRSRRRRLATRLGGWIARRLCRLSLADPLSGFFVLDRRFLQEVAGDLSGIGFKILVDLLASARRPVRLREVRYRFRERLHGRSKLDVNTLLEYLVLVCDKLLGTLVPARFVVFSLVGSLGVLVHLAVVGLLLRRGMDFLPAQAAATVLAMTSNFALNNRLTFRDLRLSGWGFLRGLASFYAACAVGALVNFQFAGYLYQQGLPWYVAAGCGLAVGSVWNYGVSSVLTWRRVRARRRSPLPPAPG